jgi:glycopeptide antibiotics resistance protein
MVWAAFAVYLILLVWVIIFKTDIAGVIASAHSMERAINLVPFGASVIANGKVYLPEIIENVIAFMPLGLFVALLSKRGGVPKAVLWGLGASLLFEAAQYLFGIGSADITDVITNTAGALLGALLWLALRRLFKGKAEAVTGIGVLCAEIIFILFGAVLIAANL